jgi:hypothetical protein
MLNKRLVDQRLSLRRSDDPEQSNDRVRSSLPTFEATDRANNGQAVQPQRHELPAQLPASVSDRLGELVLRVADHRGTSGSKKIVALTLL